MIKNKGEIRKKAREIEKKRIEDKLAERQMVYPVGLELYDALRKCSLESVEDIKQKEELKFYKDEKYKEQDWKPSHRKP